MAIVDNGRITLGSLATGTQPGATKVLGRTVAPVLSSSLLRALSATSSGVASASSAPVVRAAAPVAPLVMAPPPAADDGLPRSVLIGGGVVGVAVLAAIAYKLTR